MKTYKKILEEIKKITTELYIGVKDSDRPYCEKILHLCEELKEGLEYKDKECLNYDKSIQKWHKRYEEIYSELQAEKQKVKELEEDIQGLKTNLLEKENCSPRYYEIITHRERVEFYNKFIFQRSEKEKYKQALEEIRVMLETIMETNKIVILQNNLAKILQKCEVLDAEKE